MGNEHHIVASIGDEVLETQVSQGYDTGDSIFTKPHTIVVAIHHCLVGHCHCVLIALQSNFHL